jgi:hypothetical protein
MRHGAGLIQKERMSPCAGKDSKPTQDLDIEAGVVASALSGGYEN